MKILLRSALLVLVALPAAASDPYPVGSVAFFNVLGTCPDGWSEYTDLLSRTVVPGPVDQAGKLVGNPLGFANQPQHSHTFSASIDPGEVSYALSSTGANHALANDHKKTSTGTTGAAGLNVPYVGFVPCQKTAAPPQKTAAPSGIVMFSVDHSGCAAGWTGTERLNGRLLVGLPTGGTAEAEFGGPALDPGQFPLHSHSIDKSVELEPHGVEGEKGGTGGYGKRGFTDATGLAATSASYFPYVMLVACVAP